ncbi:trehalose/maltose hydrolase-like predicted phosphorylase [Fontibacillus phaseoli]|uniref:Trehalose/maltose hydrolase-like predicted phosphorylase n=1 Tax=Fontibacillus phaseoli TaxID=1416533 RepID=A0A369B4M3_9BACL|nr:glycosyl hydrolase family 65 protein [Fontibacillus phaseoli]RCX16235.1 trehalose/maltose hydrolase-like predicted phosphorylase [Fontibacillus phaseoli]
MNWRIREQGFDKDRIAANGNKFMIGNGYMGYRGTMEEFTREELTATTLAGLYDRVDGKWREPVNAPNGLFTVAEYEGTPLGVLSSDAEVLEHEQELDIRQAVHRRVTVFGIPGRAEERRVTVNAERFASAERLNLLAAKISITSSADGELVIRTGIDGEVWDINGPHLEGLAGRQAEGSLLLSGTTQELKVPVAVAEAASYEFDAEAVIEDTATPGLMARELRVPCRAGETYTIYKYVAVFTGLDGAGDPGEAALRLSREAAVLGYEALLREHAAKWEEKWSRADVVIEGDEEAQLALRYSLYQLLIIAPEHSEKLSIPARGLSGQVYKGAVFWDTEMFMLPFFLYSQPEAARNLMMYRVHTLDGARRKAAEYGYEGAFYAWESQESGDDACTLFNVNDVFTGRPMRTYFRDKQVHISADVAYGIWQYYSFTGDGSLLLNGGAETVWECARFFYTYAYFNPGKQRYEILDVTGPDEYHERVNNNAFTNALVKRSLYVALEAMDFLRTNDPQQYEALVKGSAIQPEHIRDLHDRLYVPQPDAETKLIEQFDRYFALEDVPLPELKSRVLNKNEYWGGGNGLATTTQILKQADVVLMLHLFQNQYDRETKKANWEFYEPRTEHGSSLSSCIYALVAADIGSSEWAYPYFLRTATIDLTGDSKQYVGDLYIGGTHPAANGGAWMAAVLGFAGISFDGKTASIKPSMPQKWQAVELSLILRGQSFKVRVMPTGVAVEAGAGNGETVAFKIGTRDIQVAPGETARVDL